MRVDYYHPPNSPMGAAGGAARKAQRLGYDGFFTAETAHDPFMPLALAASAAPGLDFGTAIAVAFPRSPMVTAQITWDLAAATGGSFILGLGTQVKPHIVRRFSTEWKAPGPRMREYVLALRAIWDSFQNRTPLRFEGEHYRFSLLTPFFDPGPIDHPRVPVAIAGVGAYLSRVAGEVCDGFHVHPFHTVRYLDEVVLPNIAAGAESAGRSLSDVQRITTVFIVTGRDEAEMSRMREAVRTQVAFYASTPSYRVILETHGWEFGDELNQMSRRGEWEGMARLVPDEVVEEVAVVAPIDELGPAIRRRYGDRVQRVGYYALDDSLSTIDADAWAEVVAATR